MIGNEMRVEALVCVCVCVCVREREREKRERTLDYTASIYRAHKTKIGEVWERGNTR